MFHSSRPSDSTVARFLAEQSRLNFSYPYCFLGATRDRVPPGYDSAHYRAHLGAGEATFAAARRALREWCQFPSELVEIFPKRPSLEAGTNVALRIRALGMWTLAACRIVYVIDEVVEEDGGHVRRFGFAYGSLPAHVERGEERFVVEWNMTDDSVWYDLSAFSRPGSFIVWLGMPIARYYQRKFGRKSAEAMIRAVSDAGETIARESKRMTAHE